MAATATKKKEKDVTISDKLEMLLKLQQIDTEIDRIRTIRGELPLEVQDLEDEVLGLTTRIAKINDEINEIETDISDRKQGSKDSETAITKYKEQQNNVRNNREFESLAKEVEFQELEIKLSEKKIIELLTQLKQLDIIQFESSKTDAKTDDKKDVVDAEFEEVKDDNKKNG